MIGIIVSTHGNFCNEIVNSAKMFCGEINNIECVAFQPGESVTELHGKYDQAIDKLNTADGLLVFVDLFNGSPFNVALEKAFSNNKIQVVTGVNMPMLVETIFQRITATNIMDLLVIAQSSGNAGIKTSQEILAKPAEEDDL